ncbi:MAG: hypothetical protein LBD41_01180, partial [Clostridiales Family XIII bacterium]|nr:hypothetical protein [Clostridiales Family XIII bacterium]
MLKQFSSFSSKKMLIVVIVFAAILTLMTMDSKLVWAQEYNHIGSDGGAGVDSDNGGGNGYSPATDSKSWSSDQSFSGLVINGGTGGKGGAGATSSTYSNPGGTGGTGQGVEDLNNPFAKFTILTGNAEIIGGDGGSGGAAPTGSGKAKAGAGGLGGKALLSIATLIVNDGSLTVESGAKGISVASGGEGGLGGKATINIIGADAIGTEQDAGDGLIIVGTNASGTTLNVSAQSGEVLVSAKGGTINGAGAKGKISAGNMVLTSGLDSGATLTVAAIGGNPNAATDAGSAELIAKGQLNINTREGNLAVTANGGTAGTGGNGGDAIIQAGGTGQNSGIKVSVQGDANTILSASATDGNGAGISGS